MQGVDSQSLLFVRGNGARSMEAIRAVRRACDTSPEGRHSFKVVDVFIDPKLAEKYGVIATPTLITLGGPAERRLVGSMSDHQLRNHLDATGSNLPTAAALPGRRGHDGG